MAVKPLFQSNLPSLEKDQPKLTLQPVGAGFLAGPSDA